MQWNVTEQQSELNALLDAIKRGEKITFSRDGENLAQMVAIPKSKKRELGFMNIQFTSNLLEPTDQETIDLFYGKD